MANPHEIRLPQGLAGAFGVASINHFFCLNPVAGSKGDGREINYVCVSSRARPCNGWDLHLFDPVSDHSSKVLGMRLIKSPPMK